MGGPCSAHAREVGDGFDSSLFELGNSIFTFAEGSQHRAEELVNGRKYDGHVHVCFSEY